MKMISLLLEKLHASPMHVLTCMKNGEKWTLGEREQDFLFDNGGAGLSRRYFGVLQDAVKREFGIDFVDDVSLEDWEEVV